MVVKEKEEILNEQTSNSKNSQILKEYHTFKPRESFLDLLNPKTKINESEFRGFFHLVISVLIIFFFTQPILNYLNDGALIKTRMFRLMFNDLSILVIVWPLFHFWTYLAYLLQLMIMRKYPSWLCIVFKHMTQVGIFIITTVICMKSNMYVTHTIFTVTQSLIHFFKIHSYTQVNRDLREEYLMSSEEDKSKCLYPRNITFANFFYFLRAPTFVYEVSYPRTDKFRLNYFIMKLLKAFFCLTICYYVYTEYIEYSMKIMLSASLIELIIKLYFPIMVLCFTLFYMIFECVLPGYAELSRFADRQFYDDWWNSTDFEEFNRKWNKVVHMFLYRHVYVECVKRHKLSVNTSKMITFFISALLHEYFLWVTIKLIRPIMTSLMMFQIPLIYFGKKFLKKTTFGNYFFWISVVFGNSLIFILYNREYMLVYGDN